jgi:hypothetical protein
MAKDQGELSFSHDEVQALRDIVGDWINEYIVNPPYDPAIASVINKLGLKAAEDDGRSIRTQTQEKISEAATFR